MNIGYDLDGVIAKEFDFFHSLFKYIPKVCVELRDKFMPILHYPIIPGEIITGRPECDYQSTAYWLVKNKVEYLALHMPETFSIDVPKFKSYKIKKLKLDLYVESDPKQIEIIKSLCLDTEIISVKEALSRNLLK